jgi:hypothetical protein
VTSTALEVKGRSGAPRSAREVTPLSPVALGALVSLPVLCGAMAQRTTGLGLALVGAPFIVAILGARDGVSYGNALQVLLCAVVLARTWRETHWRTAGLLLAGALVVVPVGALVVAVSPEGPLLVLLGTLAVAAVVVSLFPAAGSMLRGVPGALGAGGLAGFMNVTAGVGGPMISAYALAQRLEREAFVPTAQVVLMVVNLAALLAKGLPRLPAPVWWGGLVAIAVGALLGETVARRIDARTGRWLVAGIAVAGGLATVIRGFAT